MAQWTSAADYKSASCAQGALDAITVGIDNRGAVESTLQFDAPPALVIDVADEYEAMVELEGGEAANGGGDVQGRIDLESAAGVGDSL